MEFVWIILGLNLVANFLPGLREVLNVFFKIILFIFFVGVVAIVWVTREAYNSIECSNGNVSSCYADNYEHETLAQFSASYQLEHDPPVSEQTSNYMKRYSIMRQEWYVDRLVTTRMDCVYSTYPIPTESEHCMPRYIVGGIYDGNTISFPTDDFQVPGAQAHRDMITRQVQDDWNHTTW
jgi:hypothetical protein